MAASSSPMISMEGISNRLLPIESASRPATGSENNKAMVNAVDARLICVRSQANSLLKGWIKSASEPNAYWDGPVDIPIIDAATTGQRLLVAPNPS
jgi:hypothetical protein